MTEPDLEGGTIVKAVGIGFTHSLIDEQCRRLGLDERLVSCVNVVNQYKRQEKFYLYANGPTIRVFHGEFEWVYTW